MLINSILFLFLLLFSFVLFFVNNIYIILIFLALSIIICFLNKIKPPIYYTFIFLLFINFIINLILSGYYDAIVVTARLLIMFLIVNIIIKKIGIYNLSNVIGNILKSKTISLMISISLAFIPIMILELSMIRKSLICKNFNFNLKNVLTKPSVFITTFFTNLFKRVDTLEKVLISKGVSE